MNTIQNIYQTNLALLTDLYQLTMSYGYWKLGKADEQAVFHLFFRKPPFASGYTISAGLGYVVDFLSNFQITDDDVTYLGTLQGNDGKPLFIREYLNYLREMTFTCDIDAIPEGTVVFPNEPLVRVTGPIIQCQILESLLLNIINFQTLIATKSARICQAAGDDPVLEFGLRRAQGIDGALAASRAAYIGGAAATSNVLAGKLLGIPVKGTHAHSWVMSFDTEMQAFDGYADAMPNNCVFLVDTYDTLDGVRHAIEVGQKLRKNGHKMVGIRLDSGDLTYLSIEARKLLDEAGFNDAAIVASNDLDETIIENLKQQGATINVWGVGTRLVTAHEQPALGGVYKLGAIRQAKNDTWQPRIKVSEQAIKTSIPGIQQVRRYKTEKGLLGDMIFDEATLGAPDSNHATSMIDPADVTRMKIVPAECDFEDLLIPVFRQGKCVYDKPNLADIRQRTQSQLAMLHPTIRRFMNPHEYPVGLEPRLHGMRTDMAFKARGVTLSKR